MKQPKVYIKHLNKVLEVESIRFDTKVVGVYNEDRSMYSYYDFEDIEFIYNTGFKDMYGNYIYTGDILEYKDTGERYLRKYVVEKLNLSIDKAPEIYEGLKKQYVIYNTCNTILEISTYFIIASFMIVLIFADDEIFSNKNLLED